MYRRLQYVVVAAAVVTPLIGPPGYGAARPIVKPAAHSLESVDLSKPPPEPLKLPNSALEPIDWNALGGWATDDHAAAFCYFRNELPPFASDHPFKERHAPDVPGPDARLPPGTCCWPTYSGAGANVL